MRPQLPTTICLLMTALATGEPLGAERSAIQLVTIDQLSQKKTVTLQPRVKCIIDVVQDDTRRRESFPEDWLVLRIKDLNQKILANKPFYSSYQRFRIDIVDLDGDGRREFVFTLGTGRGTSARQETLSIERFEDYQFRLVVTTPLSDFYASGSKWWYSVEFRDTDGDGVTDVELKLHSDDNDSALRSLDGRVPSEHTKVFRWRKVAATAGKGATNQLETEF